MDQLSSGIPTAEAIPISASEAAGMPLAEASAVEAHVVPNNLRLQPGTFGATAPATSSSEGMTNDELRARRLQYYQPNAASNNEGAAIASNNGPFDDELPVAKAIESSVVPIAIPLSDEEMFRADIEAGRARGAGAPAPSRARGGVAARLARTPSGRMEGPSGSYEVSITRLDLRQRALLIAAINVAGARYARMAVDQQPDAVAASIDTAGAGLAIDRQPGAIKRAVKDVTADPLFQEKLKEAEVKGLKAYELFSASTRTYEATQKEKVQDTLLPQQQQQQQQVAPYKDTGSSDQGEATLPVKNEVTSSSGAVDGAKKLDEKHQEIVEAGKKEDDKVAKKSDELKAKQQEKRMTEREAQLANMANVENPLVMA